MKRSELIRLPLVALAVFVLPSSASAQLDPHPFGKAAKDLWIDCATTGNWDSMSDFPEAYKEYRGAGTHSQIISRMQDRPRDQVVAFAMYTHDGGVLKVTGQLYPLTAAEFAANPDARLELFREGAWQEVDRSPVVYPGWSVQFRVEGWDSTKDVRYRVRHGASSAYEGLIRHDPVDQDEIVVAMLGCIGTNFRDDRAELVAGIALHEPDLVFFYGDQHYVNYQHTSPFLEFGRVFKELFRERPVVLICDDHDYNQGNIWGNGGVTSPSRGGTQGGFYFAPSYVNMIERGMTSHLPDPHDPTPVARGIGVYYTRLRCGGVDFSILEDRKWKSGPANPAKFIAKSDKLRDPAIDTTTFDKDGLVLLGQRQLDFLRAWGQDWTGAEMKAVLSQTTFAAVPHIHGSFKGRQVANFDANGWPQTPRNNALREMRRAMAIHLAGDQHLASVIQYGIDAHRDAPYAFTGPAAHNSIFRRWWHPLSEKAGPRPRTDTTLPWTGDYLDGFRNRITMLAYANPPEQASLPPAVRGDGFAIIRFNKPERTIRMECYDRYPTKADGAADHGEEGGTPVHKQRPGWPLTVKMMDNDGRQIDASHRLPELVFTGQVDPVVQVIEEVSGEILYTVRAKGDRFTPKVYAAGKYTVRTHRDNPSDPAAQSFAGLPASPSDSPAAKRIEVSP